MNHPKNTGEWQKVVGLSRIIGCRARGQHFRRRRGIHPMSFEFLLLRFSFQIKKNDYSTPPNHHQAKPQYPTSKNRPHASHLLRVPSCNPDTQQSHHSPHPVRLSTPAATNYYGLPAHHNDIPMTNGAALHRYICTKQEMAPSKKHISSSKSKVGVAEVGVSICEH
jgi:hypothetical protein